MISASLAAGSRQAIAGVVIKNVFAMPAVQKKFFGAVVAWIGNKSGLEKKEAEYNESLASLFDSLDMYASLIGPSILVHGMLKRYVPQVMSLGTFKGWMVILSLVAFVVIWLFWGFWWGIILRALVWGYVGYTKLKRKK